MFRFLLAILAFGWAPPVGAGDSATSSAPRAATRAKAEGANSLPSLFTSDDYPIEALRAGEEGTAHVRLTISAGGVVSKCDVITSSGSVTLDRATCTIFQERARFIPARDTQGNATTDLTHQRIRWLLPGARYSDHHIRVVFAATSSSKPADCKVEPAPLTQVDLCGSMADLRTSILAMANRPNAAELIFESGQLVGGEEAIAKVGTGDGLNLFDLMAVMVAIDAKGAVIDCRPIAANSGPDPVVARCATARNAKYEPSKVPNAAPRSLILYRATYLRGVVPGPKLTNWQQLFGADDYPGDALSQMREGWVTAKVTVEADGRASECVIAHGSGTPSLDNATCRILVEKGKFSPGQNIRKQPYRAVFEQRVRWLLPRSPFQDQIARATFDLAGNGEGKTCTIDGPEVDGLTCDGARKSVGAALRSEKAKTRKTLIVENGHLIGDGESIAAIGSGKGETSWFLSAITIVINAEGKVVDCRPHDWMADEYTIDACDYARTEQFVPLATDEANRSNRYLTRYEAIYFRD